MAVYWPSFAYPDLYMEGLMKITVHRRKFCVPVRKSAQDLLRPSQNDMA